MDKNFCFKGLKLKHKITVMLLSAMTATILSIQLGSVSNVEAHSGTLVNVNGKDYWIWVDAIEPAVIDMMGGGDVYISEADPQDPLNPDSNKTKPVDGIDTILKFNVIADGKNKTFDLHKVWNSSGVEVGHYEAPFIHTVKTSYDYELFGNWNGTAFLAKWRCTPDVTPEYLQTNETITLSEGVVQKAQSGPFTCPQQLSEISFPEPSLSNVEIQSKLNGTDRN